jgi:hypothetical protein
MSKRDGWLVAMGLLGLLPACAGSEPMPTPPAAPDQATPVETSPMPEPLAQIKQENGNTVSFYDLDGQGLILGEGLAGSPPALPASMDKRVRPLDAWNQLSGGQAAPQRLVDFQKKLDTTPPAPADLKMVKPAPTKALQGGVSLDDVPVNTPEGTLAAPDGCNNGCCDYQWLSTFQECYVNGVEYQWFAYNYGSSYANSGNVQFVHAMVCAATGTSTWKFYVNGKGFTNNVAEGHYQQGWWAMAGDWPLYSTGSLSSSVNTPSTLHLHTYCGYLDYYF